MSKMTWLIWAIASLLMTLTSAQTTNDLAGFFISEGLSVYSEVTSAIASVQSEASEAAATAPSSDVDISTSSTATDGSSDSATSTPRSPSEATSTSSPNDPTSTFRLSSGQSATEALPTEISSSSNTAAAGAASQSSGTASASQNDGIGNKNLPIILGCVLGALALGLLILVFLLCCKRRRNRSRRSHSISDRGLSPESVEVETWRRPNGAYETRHGSSKETQGAAPLMSEHPAFKNHQNHDNPFVPVPPPPRKSAPNSRVGLTDGTVPGDDPYLLEKETGQPLSKKSIDSSSSHKGRNLAMGAGVAALGAAAMHHHHKNKDRGIEVNNPYAEPIGKDRTIARKPLPPNSALTQAPWMSSPTTANDDAFALSKLSGRRSGESSRSRASRDAARANAAFDDIYAPLPSHGIEPQTYSHGSNNQRVSTAAALGAGALGGAALAHHHNRSRSSSAHSHSHAHSPHRHPHALAGLEKDAHTNSDTSTSSNSKDYTDALPHQTPMDRVMSPQDIPSPMEPHRNRVSGRSPPAAALLSYVYSEHEHAKEQARNRSRSSSRPRSYPIPPSEYPPNDRVGEALPVPPTTPPRHPARASFPQHRDYAHMPLTSSVHSAMNPPSPPAPAAGGIVGDNGFPHLNVPRRKSGGEYDHGIPPPMEEGSFGGAMASSKHNSSSTSRPLMENERNDSEDSAWRLSMGMPGGWARHPRRPTSRSSSPGTAMGVLGRRSGEHSRVPFSDTNSAPYGGGGNRDSVMSGSTAVSGPAGAAAGAGKRLRLSDLQRQEAELLRNRGRESMGSEWGGDGGYDGYDGWGGGGYGSGGHGYGGEGYGEDYAYGHGAGESAGGQGRYYSNVGVAR